MIVPLTSLRGLAALAVMAFHFAPMMGGFGLFSRGFLGVDLFFLLSGFILTHVYKRQVEVGSFLFARIARTYPLHLFTIALLLPALGRGEAFSGTALACNLSMTQVLCGGPLSWNSVSWSLSAEWISYLTFPLLLRPVLTCPRWLAGVAILCCAGVLVAVSPITDLDHYRMGALSRSFPEFLAGMILYRVYRDKWLAHWGWFAGAVAVMAIALATGAPDIVVLGAFAVIILASPYVALLEHRALAFLGDISFSLYMVHLPIGVAASVGLLALGLRNGIAISILAMAASMLFATVVYRCIEVPARTGLRRWLAGAPAAVTPRVGG